MHTSKLRSWIGALLLGLALLGCGGGEDSTTVGTACQVTSDCGPGGELQCIDGA